MGTLRYFKWGMHFRPRPKDGHLVFKGERVIIAPSGSYSKLYNRLTDIVGKGGAASALYLGSKEVSKPIYRLALKLYSEDKLKNEKTFGNALEDLMALAGYGKVEYVKIDFEKPEAIIRMRGLLTPSEIEKSDVPVCHVERGVLTGFIECITKKVCNGQEVKCVTMGDEFCEFFITGSEE